MSTTVRTSRVLLGAAAACTLAAGCGSASGTGDEGAAADAQTIVKQLRRLHKGEILIVGRKPVRDSGPYAFADGTYLFRFRQQPSPSGNAHVKVALESRRGSSRSGYRLVVDTDRPSGRRVIHARGKFFVHVETTSPSYVLRFTPRR